VLEQPLGGLLGGLCLADDHVTQHSTDGEEPLSGGADVVQADLRVEKDGDEAQSAGLPPHACR
jgi:hypothetical protein